MWLARMPASEDRGEKGGEGKKEGGKKVNRLFADPRLL